jgi:hypothetical protein
MIDYSSELASLCLTWNAAELLSVSELPDAESNEVCKMRTVDVIMY